MKHFANLQWSNPGIYLPPGGEHPEKFEYTPPNIIPPLAGCHTPQREYNTSMTGCRGQTAKTKNKNALTLTLTAVRKLLLLPVGMATVKRSFSIMNRIVSSQRCRLLPAYACQGPDVPDVRDGNDSQQQSSNALIDKAYAKWQEKP